MYRPMGGWEATYNQFNALREKMEDPKRGGNFASTWSLDSRLQH